MNSQQLEILKDLIVEKLSKNEALDKTTRTHLGNMLKDVKKEIEYHKNALVGEMNNRAIFDELTAEEQLAVEEQNE